MSLSEGGTREYAGTHTGTHTGARGAMNCTRRLLAIALAGWMTACQPSTSLFADQPLQAGESLKIGVMASEAGTYSNVGLPILSALLLLRDTVNACGGVNRAPITLVIYDSSDDHGGPAAGLRYLVNEVGVHAIVAAFEAPIGVDTLAIALDRNVSVLSPTTATTVQPRRRSSLKGWGQLSLTETQQAQALAKLAIARKWQRAAVLVSDTEHGLRFKQSFTRAFEALSGTVVTPDVSVDYSTRWVAADRPETPAPSFPPP
ncbi:MAG: ABC transporter substrate-binding protein, partial [Elainellaceae cyanobacterium]